MMLRGIVTFVSYAGRLLPFICCFGVTHGDALESANRWLSGKIVEVVTKCETDILHANIEGLDIQ